MKKLLFKIWTTIEVALIATAFAISPVAVPALAAKSANLALQANAMATRASAAVVEINVYKNTPSYGLRVRHHGIYLNANASNALRRVAAGSGFFISANGYILTNDHVVSDTSAIYKVNYNDELLPATVVYHDAKQDLAIVKVDGTKYPTIALANSSKVKVGDKVVAIGNALGEYINYTTQGKITALNRTVSVDDDTGNSEILSGVMQTSAKIYPGESGGPLLDLNGNVVAINTATEVGYGDAIVAGFSIPADVAKKVIADAGVI